MISPADIFKADPGHIFDFSASRPADIFNQAVLPAVNALEAKSLLDDQAAAVSEFAMTPYRPPSMVSTGPAPSDEASYDEPVDLPDAQPNTKAESIKLANYGYDSDTTPDYNSNVKKIGHANNPLVDGYSAALTKSLAKRYGLRTGDEFEIVTADGKRMVRRYDDTVPTTYRGKKLPETVDLYETKGSNSFGGKVVGIRPVKKTTEPDLPAGASDATDLLLPPR
jgi:hypothetical protein